MAQPLTSSANRSLFHITASKPTQGTKCGVIFTSDDASGLVRVRTLEPGSLLRAAGLREGDIIIDIDGTAAVGAVQLSKALRSAFGSFGLLVKRPSAGSAGVGHATVDAPLVWTIDMIKQHADEKLSTHLTLQSTRTVSWIGGRAAGLDLRVGDRVLSVDGENVSRGQPAEELWLQAAAGKAVVVVVEAGESRAETQRL